MSVCKYLVVKLVVSLALLFVYLSLIFFFYYFFYQAKNY